MAIKVTYANATGPSPWPPPPSQLFSALIASWGAQGEREGHRKALEWLECLEPPAITAGMGSERSRVAFAPLAAPEVREFPPSATAGQILGHYSSKGRNEKEWKDVSLESKDVWYHYPPGEFDVLIDELCSGVSYLGNSSHLVEVSLDPAPPAITHHPHARRGVMLGVPRKGRFQHCVDRFYEIPNKKQPTPRPARAPRIRYGSADHEKEEAGSRRTFRFRFVGRSFGINHAAPFAEKFHRALVALAKTDIPEVIHGHHGNGLTFSPVGFGDNLTSFDITFPDRTFEDPRVCNIVARLLENGLGNIQIECPGEVYGKTALLWRTRTPIVWHTHPRPSRMETIVERMCEKANLPIPASLEILSDHDVRRFRLPRRYRKGFFVSHAVVKWDEPVTGPINLGAARNFAMGSLIPCSLEED